MFSLPTSLLLSSMLPDNYYGLLNIPSAYTDALFQFFRFLLPEPSFKDANLMMQLVLKTVTQV